MIKRVVITNHLGESMEYLIEGVQAENPSGLLITSIEGLGPVKATINMTELTTTDGQLYNSSRLTGRNIIIKALFTHASSIEEARYLSYKYFPIKSKVKFRIETDNRIGETEGYVESNEPDIFSDQSGCQISILCENPYFDGGEISYDFSLVNPAFKFKFGNADLNKKLLKMSENKSLHAINTVVYDGDADAGINLVIEVLQDEMKSRADVTGIKITKDGDETLQIDTAKMASFVPNTAPNELDATQCAFTYNKYGIYKFLKEIPPTPAMGMVGAAVVYNHELHILGHEHYKWNGFNWVKSVPFNDISSDYFVNYAVAYHDAIHIIVGRKHLKWVEGDTKWTELGDLPISNPQTSIGGCVVFEDKINILGGRYQPNISRSDHYWWDETRDKWNLIGTDLPFQYDFAIAVFKGAIHVIGGIGNNNVISRMHRKWDGKEWTDVGQYPGQVYGAKAVVYRDELHVFGGTVNSSENKHYKWDGIERSYSDNFIEQPDLPYDAFGYFGLTCFEDKIYILGSTDSGTYTEVPNNICLIEKDKLIVTTGTGKKSLYLYRDGYMYNVINSLDKNPSWFKLVRGVNRFDYEAATNEEDLKISIIANKWYEGV